jgi:two-component sensor histidine kinase
MERSAQARPSLIPPKRVPSFELLFRPSVNLIHVVRCFVTDFYAKVVVEPDTVQRLALATHELLENAHKYSNDGEVALFVECDIESGAVCARTMNRASTAQIAAVEQAFAAMSRAPDSAAFYLAAMRQTVSRTDSSAGLGLARIWAESEMTLRLSVRGDCVEIFAIGRIGQ